MPVEGRSLAKIVERLEGDSNPANRLAHPMYMGHQVAAPLRRSRTEAIATEQLRGRGRDVAHGYRRQARDRWMCDRGFWDGRRQH
jgi:hypothetical protein